ncbi:Arabinanase/levansucrase/invertase [Fomitiporia mediterranea MF3/22]|uniref:Arabinanase/levansucrase/invertase n=1 Tax=Fomitiporia mediterranea (strain MF3/22) TaxID=694068 RepID=UPI0004407FF4|nr:Arabinanase/levansucrase/invertase [Fomitiporia mediterranea MF3/22]EJD04256.1 Arabinanase/levansucrase/invertase [Fomitiporia mediterranea MF3/22]
MSGLLKYIVYALSAYTVAVSGESVIVPGAAWTDTSGNIIQAHGAGILKVGSTFYWFGEDKAANSALFSAVSCYTSSDLVNWSRQTNALTPTSGTMISSSNIVERPKVIFNEKNQEYVMWFHSDTSNYGAAMVGVATAKTPCGPYSYKSSWKPLGADSRDEGLFLDTDQSAYLLYASDNNQNFKIAQLDTNYYNVTSVVSQLNGATLEAPGIVKRDGAYCLIASHTSGWDPNPNKFFKASSLSGPWSSQADIAPESTRTYFSQNAFDLPLGSNAIYMGDRWRPSLLGSSRYIWYPLDWSSGSPQIVPADVWSVNVNAGTYTVASGTAYEAEAGTISGSATVLSDSSFSGGKAVGYLGNGGSVTINNVQGNGQGQWVSLYYANGDSTWRNTTVSVNGGPSTVVDQPNTGGGHVILSVPVKLDLRNGANSVTFSAGQSNYAADLDKIIVYQQG